MDNLINLRKMIHIKIAQLFFIITMVCFSAGISGCGFSSNKAEVPLEVWDSLTVSASAYNSVVSQTGAGNPKITAWGDTLKPGIKVIAVSRDLIKKGFDYNTPVRIDGLEGVYYVKDKMHHRWKNKIDIYMGENVKKARKWGRKKIKIYYLVQIDSLTEIQ
jgi:3D (Asp-Asp-Asp) domain-containing protein